MTQNDPKVLLVNMGPHKNGCTQRALDEVAGALEEEGMAADFFWVGAQPLAGCLGCHQCDGSGRCFRDDTVNEFLDLATDCAGFVFGTPVHYASASGMATSFMDRIFYAGSRDPHGLFRMKPAAAVASARRAGTTATLDQLNKYFSISEMPIVSSQYWNMVHGNTPAEVEQDLEGLQIMRTLGRNMAYLIKCQQAAAAAGIEPPEREPRVGTNFIR